MAQGFQIFDGSGNLIIDTSTMILKQVEVVATTAASGTVDISTQLAGATATLAPVPILNSGGYEPTLAVSGNSVSWAQQREDMPINMRLNVMVF